MREWGPLSRAPGKGGILRRQDAEVGSARESGVMKQIPWGERRFEFPFPDGVYPELIERLRGTPARLADRLAKLPPDLLSRRPSRGWSMQEHCGHLGDLDKELFLRRLEEYAQGAKALTAADMENRLTEEARHNERPFAAVLASVREARQAVIARLERFEAADFARVAIHPRLGCPMRLVDLLFFQAEHDDYHLARISGLLASAWR